MKPDNAQGTSKKYRTFVLLLLTLVYGFNFIDRQIVGILAPFIQADLGLSNSQLGLLIGFAFAVLYTVVGIPIALMADRMNRVNILSISLAMWSAFTALTGFANNFVQIGLARMGVGIGEAGGSPPSHSIISDFFPKEERATALGIYSLGIPLGIMSAYFVTAALMGADPQTVNWRRIFVMLGVSGIILAVIVRVLLREPVRGNQELKQGAIVVKRSFRENLSTLLKIKSWWFMCLGIATASFASYAFSGFQTKFLRLLDPSYDFRQIVIYLGIINGTGYAAGTFLGAKLADKWGAKTVRAYGWVPAIAISTVFPFALLGFWADSVNMHLFYSAIMLSFLGVYLGPSFAIAQTLAPIHMRAMSTALFFFILNMIALGGGPTTAGWLIDVFKNGGQDEFTATKYALSFVTLGFLVSVGFFIAASKTLPKDWAEAQRRNEGLVARAEDDVALKADS